ncbi:MAG: ABC transporter permease [Myxococcota bacterium]|nr:ABC transporter permease [Myxococcota bacterium]
MNTKLRFGILICGFFAAMAIVGPFLVQDPQRFVSTPLLPPNTMHWMGTTGQGQDVLAQTVVGAQLTLGMALLIASAVVFLGALIGCASGYFGGWIDDILSLFTNLFLVLPGLPLMVVLAAYLPPGPVSIALVLSLTGWAWNARVFRAQVLSLRQRDFVSAAQLAGAGHLEILFVEILPNLLSLMGSTFIGAVIYAIGAQVGLEFLGLGDIGSITWGSNLYWASNDAALLTGSWWTFVPTGLSIALLGFGLTLVLFGLDEKNNPKIKMERHWVASGGDLQRGITPIEKKE